MGEEMKLKPCPFCGGVVSLEQPLRATGDNWWGVVCRNTGNLGGTCAIEQRASRTKEAAIERWNRRSPDPELVAVLRAVVFNSIHGNGLEAQHQALDRARALLSRIREGGEG